MKLEIVSTLKTARTATLTYTLTDATIVTDSLTVRTTKASPVNARQMKKKRTRKQGKNAYSFRD